MSEQSLIIPFSLPSTVTDDYWIRLEQAGLQKDAVSLGQAAALVDAAFNKNPCEPVEEQPEPVEEEDFVSAVQQILTLNLCYLAADGSFDTQLKIIRSHQGEPYVLRLSNGSIDKTIVVNDEYSGSIRVEKATSVTLDWPVISGFVCSMPGAELIGNTLHWQDEYTGKIFVRYQTVYDLVDITVFGSGEDGPGECEAIGFFHGLVDVLSVQAPQVDEDADDLDQERFCEDSPGSVVQCPGDTVSCYELLNYVYRCDCSGEEAYRRPVERDIECPKKYCCKQVGVDDNTCRHLVGSRVVMAGYVDCGVIEELNDPEFYEQKCCTPPPWGLPGCFKRLSMNSGGHGIEGGQQKYIDIYGSVKFVPVSPADGDCGKIETIQVIAALACCEGIDPLQPKYIDTCNRDIGLNDTVVLCVTEGRPPYKWSVSGSGYTLEEEITTGPGNLLMSGASVCTAAQITVSDDCSQTSFAIPQTEAAQAPVQILNYDIVASSGSYLSILISGGVPPFIWTAGADLTLDSWSDSGAVFKVADPFCGTSSIAVSDACGSDDSITVRSADGFWSPVPEGEFEPCEAPAGIKCAAIENPGDYCEGASAPELWCQNGAYKIYAGEGVHGYEYTCAEAQVPLACPMGTEIVPVSGYGVGEFYCQDCVPGAYGTCFSYTGGGCCQNDTNCDNPNDPSYQYSASYQVVSLVWEWICI